MKKINISMWRYGGKNMDYLMQQFSMKISKCPLGNLHDFTDVIHDYKKII